MLFKRELRGIWEKADPLPTTSTIEAARNFRIYESE
jgi:hypothetical protein